MDKVISMIKQYLPHLLIALLALWIWSKYMAPCNCNQSTNGTGAPAETDPASTEVVTSPGFPGATK